MSLNWWISNEDVIQTYCGILFSCKKDEIMIFEGKRAEPETSIPDPERWMPSPCSLLVVMSVHLSTLLTVSERNFVTVFMDSYYWVLNPSAASIFRPNKSSYFHLKLRISDGFYSPNLSFHFNCNANVCQVALVIPIPLQKLFAIQCYCYEQVFTMNLEGSIILSISLTVKLIL